MDYGLQMVLVACVAVSVTFAYGIGVVWVLQDRPLTGAAGVIFFSPVMMLILRFIELIRLEGAEKRIGRALQMFNPRRQSWAFMFGDTFVLSFAMIALTNGWESVPASSWFHSTRWALIAVWIGVVLSLVFMMIDRQRYVNRGIEAALISPTKIWHDMAVFPVVLSLLIFSGVPQIMGNWSFHTVVALVAITVFTGLCGADMVRDKRETLDPADQHLCWDPIGFCPIPMLLFAFA